MTQTTQLDRVFISYADPSGLAIATAIREELRSCRVNAWVWGIDHPSGYVFQEIANRIREADYICWVCTDGTTASEGQDWEIENAFGQGKLRRSWVVTTDRKFVPPVLAGYFQYTTTLEETATVVGNWVNACQAGFPSWPALENDVAESHESEGQEIEAVEYSDGDA